MRAVAAGVWAEQRADDGRRYYWNKFTNTSKWELSEEEKVHLVPNLDPYDNPMVMPLQVMMPAQLFAHQRPGSGTVWTVAPLGKLPVHSMLSSEQPEALLVHIHQTAPVLLHGVHQTGLHPPPGCCRAAAQWGAAAGAHMGFTAGSRQPTTAICGAAQQRSQLGCVTVV